jgi:hypothetical protein
MYILEDDIDFYKMLSSSDGDVNNDDNDLCMISKTKLDETMIVLDCNHKFNYIPLMKDMYTRLYLSHDVKCMNRIPYRKNTIECPYCRHKNPYILPFDENIYNIKIYGLNTSDIQYIIQECFASFSEIKKCSVEDCDHYYYSGYVLPFCKNHVSDKKITKDYKKSEREKYLVLNNMLCKSVLKSGTRKGEFCNKKCENGGLCKRHKDKIPEIIK